MTINLGDFKLLQSKQGSNQVAVLVQAREGPDRGTILQHPLMDARRSVGQTLAGEKYQLPAELVDRLLEGGDVDVDYLDPMATAEDGRSYAGKWIAAMQPVAIPNGDSEDDPSASTTDSDLLVLVQYRLEKVMAPVRNMTTDLMWEGAAAIVSILIVTLSLWLFVRRVGHARESNEDRDMRHTGTTETIQIS
jgi:hypothetical protein